MANFLLQPAPKTAKLTTIRTRILRREARTARRIKAIITISIIAITVKKVAIIKAMIIKTKIKITTRTAVKATTAKTRRVALSSIPADFSPEKLDCRKSVPL